MAITCTTHRHAAPREPAGRIVEPDDVLDALLVATHHGTDPAVVVACIDGEGLPVGMFVVDDCPADKAGFILDFLLDAVGPVNPAVTRAVLATSRPGTDPEPSADERAAWPGLVTRSAAAGVDLLGWYLLVDGQVRTIGSRG